MNFKLHDYQNYVIEYIESHPVSAVLLDMGFGKTVISLSPIAVSCSSNSGYRSVSCGP